MLKIIAFLVILYFFMRSLGSVVRLFFGTGHPNTQQRKYPPGRQSNDGLHVDYAPKKNDTTGKYKGGDYVDFEEVE